MKKHLRALAFIFGCAVVITLLMCGAMFFNWLVNEHPTLLQWILGISFVIVAYVLAYNMANKRRL